MPPLVKIQRGKYAPYFQCARAWLSAASALATVNPKEAIEFIDHAIGELQSLKIDIRIAMPKR